LCLFSNRAGLLHSRMIKHTYVIVYNRPAQRGSRRGPIRRKDKQLRAAVSFVVTNMLFLGGGGIAGWYFEFVCSEVRFPKHFCVVFRNCCKKNIII
jgi:hypothetical protein